MPLQIIRNDITKIACDAIVNAANSSLLGGGGVDGAIHKAAGKGLLAECKGLGGCNTGEAKITGTYNLPCKYVIHTVGPVWKGGKNDEQRLLALCYENSLKLAKDNGCTSIAFPLISSGAYRYPKDKALDVAVSVISRFLLENEMTVYIVIYDKTSYIISKELYSDIESYIDDNYITENDTTRRSLFRRMGFSRERSDVSYNYSKTTKKSSAEDVKIQADEAIEMQAGESSAMLFAAPMQAQAMPTAMLSLDDALSQIDESFSEMLLRKIDEKDMTDSQCYKKANIDRKLFSKIRSDRLYKPSKQTVIAFAIALELPLEETKEMLMKAGFALSHSNKFDIIIEYFIKNNNYNVFEINEALFSFDQNLLGC
ncbi:MAG: macro domain-containing protein [Acutalibacteraceae bacterium]